MARTYSSPFPDAPAQLREPGPGRASRRIHGLGPALLLLSPALIFVLGAIAYPLVLEVWFSFSDAEVGELGRFVGLSNFRHVALGGVYHDALANTLIYAVGTVALKLVLGMALALALARPFRGRRLVYAVLFLPFIFPTTMGTIAWYYLFSNVHGGFNYVLVGLGLVREPIRFLGSNGPLPMLSLITVNVWHGAGLFLVLLLASLRAIPSDLLDAALLDGANRARRFVYLVLPLLVPAMVLATALSLMGGFGDFAIVRQLTNGGPANHTQTVHNLAYLIALRDGDLGISAALALTLLPAYLLVLAYMLRTVVRR